jgi:hypothetical protein
MARYFEIIIKDELVGKLAISEQAMERLNNQESDGFAYDLSPQWFIGTLEQQMADDFGNAKVKIVEKGVNND